MNQPLKLTKLAAIAFIAGVAVAASVEVLGHCLDALNVHPHRLWSAIVIWIWPTGFYLIGTSNDWGGYVALVIAVAANGLLYAFFAFVVGYCINAVIDIRMDE